VLLATLLVSIGAWWAWDHRGQLLQQAVTRTLEHWKDSITTQDLQVTTQGGLSANSIKYRDDKVEVSLSGLKGDLLARTVSAEQVEVKLLTPENKTPWSSLAPPVDFALEQLRIGRLRVLRGEQVLSEFSNITGAFAHRAKAFVFSNAHMEIAACGAQCALNASGNIASTPPFATQAKVVFHYPLIGHPLLLRGDATGNLFALKIAGHRQGDMEWRALRGAHSIALTLLDPKPIWLSMNYSVESLKQANLGQSGIALPLPALDMSLTSTFELGTHTGGPIKLTNRKPLPYDQGGLPVSTLTANLQIGKDALTLKELQLDQQGKGELHYDYRSQALRAKLPVTKLDPAHWHSATAKLPKGWTGALDLKVPTMKAPLQNLAIQFQGQSADLTDYVGRHTASFNATINGTNWTIEQANLRSFSAQSFVQELRANATEKSANINLIALRPALMPRAWLQTLDPKIEKWIAQYAPLDMRDALSTMNVTLQLEGDLNRAQVQKITGQAQGQGNTVFNAELKKSAQLWQINAALTGQGKVMSLSSLLTESGKLAGRSQLGVRAPTWNAEQFTAASVDLQATLDSGSALAPFQIKGKIGALSVGKSQLEQTTFALSGTQTSDSITGNIEQFNTREKGLLSRAWELRLARPARFEYRQQQFSLDAAALSSTYGTVQLDNLRWRPESMQASLSNLAIESRELLALFAIPDAWRNAVGSSPLTGSAQFSLPLSVNGQADFGNAKATGKLQLTTASSLVQSATLEFSLEQLRARGQLELRNTQQATLSAKINLPLAVQQNALALARDQALELDASGQTDVGLLSPWIDNDVRLAGALQLNVRVRGTLDKPLSSGTLAGTDLRLQHPPSNLSLSGGSLRAQLDGTGMTVDEWRMLQGTGAERGELTVQGRYTWGGSNDDAFQVTVRKLLLPISPDQRLVVSGKGNLKVRPSALHLDAKVSADQARLSLRQEKTQDLGDDVKIIRRSKTGTSLAAPSPTAKPIAFTSDIEVDLGQDFRFSGEGIKGRLEGKVQLLANGANSLRSLGSVNIVEGSYARFGQSLKIERGVLRFAGPIDNPSLDIEAVRPNLAVNVSVRVAGTAQSPKVRLESATAMSEAEKLSWLALGAPLGDTLSSEQSGTFASALAGLLADATGAESGITQTLGLSQLGMAKNDKGTNIVTVGKRLGDRLLVTYEQGLRGVWNILRVQLQLTKQLEVRVQAGTESSIDLLWVIPLQQ
jgi:TamB, inner membrane protein subunit of TAM complex